MKRAQREITNPNRSERRCAASVRIASDPEMTPPTISALINMTHTTETQHNLRTTF